MRQSSGVQLRLARVVGVTTALAVVFLAGYGAVNTVLGRQSTLDSVEVAARALVLLAGSWFLLLRAIGRRRLAALEPVQARVSELKEQARTDNLTQLGNHRAFHQDLAEMLAQRVSTGEVLTLMAVDLDGLKRINDTKGHPAGDVHIRTVAECLKALIDVVNDGVAEVSAPPPTQRSIDAVKSTAPAFETA